MHTLISIFFFLIIFRLSAEIEMFLWADRRHVLYGSRSLVIQEEGWNGPALKELSNTQIFLIFQTESTGLREADGNAEKSWIAQNETWLQ